MVLGGLAYPPAVYYGMQNVMEKPQSGQVVIQPNTDPGIDIEIPRELRIKECPGGYQVPDSMPCPSQPSGIGALTGRFIKPTGPNDLMTIFGDQATKNPGLVFDKDGVAHFPRGINVDTILSGGTDLVAGKVWKGSPVNLGCSVSRNPGDSKATIKCGSAPGVDIPDGKNGTFDTCVVKTVTKQSALTGPGMTLNAACVDADENPSGILTGGGCAITGAPGTNRTAVISAIPTEDGTYRCFFDPPAANLTLNAYAVCCSNGGR